jgi:hypothetical protein
MFCRLKLSLHFLCGFCLNFRTVCYLLFDKSNKSYTKLETAVTWSKSNLNIMNTVIKLLSVCEFYYQNSSITPRYNWNIVESGVKHHKPKPKQIIPLCHILFITWQPSLNDRIFGGPSASLVEFRTQFHTVNWNASDLFAFKGLHDSAKNITIQIGWRPLDIEVLGFIRSIL